MNHPPVIVAYGMGVDSTAMLIGLRRGGMRPDLILFADTGGEKPETYAYLPVIQEYLAKHGFPPVIVVKYTPKHSRYLTLEENCLANKTLVSLAFGYKKCSMKFKREPQDKWVNKNFEPAHRAWKEGLKCVKFIGYDNGPKDTKRAWNLKEDKKYQYIYPLREWGWDRERCIAEIEAEGMPVPMKSACFYCPASKPEEIRWLAETHPDLARRIVRMEANAAPNLVKIEGLWRKSTKKHPGSMTQFLEESCGFDCNGG